ncbi:MAG: hypothetical protein QNJ51_01655 [Calothrix sp. MO_167.B12]|nr:hypothetical protein [Calothrix sp. MO_167.B12]
MMSTKKKILFFSPYGLGLVHKQVDAVVATALRLRECEVLVVGCDGIYNNCAVTRGDSSRCEQCAHVGKDFFANSFGLPFIQIGNFITQEDYNIANNWLKTVSPKNYHNAIYDDIPIGSWVTSNIYTYFRISATGLSRKDVQEVHKKYLIDGLVTYKALLRIFHQYQPTHAFLFNGRFAPYRIAFEVASQMEVDVITHERGGIDDSFTFFDNYPTWNPQPRLNCVKSWENTILTAQEIEQTKTYFIHREYGINLNWPSFYNFQTNYIDIRNQLRIPLDAKIVVVFTSSEDELAAFDSNNNIAEQFNIVAKLIEIFRTRNEYLVIRHHPFIGGNQKDIVETYSLSNAYKQVFYAPENVRFVMPSEQLTSYALLWHADAAIACFSTVAIEAIARGVPTATLATSAYAQASRHNITDTSEENLNQLVDNLLSESAKVITEDLKRLYRFTNAFIFKFSHKFRSIGIKDFHFADIRFENVSELQPGIDPTLDKVCNRIILGSSLENLPSDELNNRLPEQEEAFYQQELEEIEQHKNLVREQTFKHYHHVNPDEIQVGIIYLNYKTSHTDQSQLLFDNLLQSRYKNITIHEIKNCDFESYNQTITSIESLIEDISAEYILIANNYTQYDESFISSSIDILKSTDSQDINGVFHGAWLSSIEDRIEEGIFIPGIFMKNIELVFQRANITYEQALELLPLIDFPLTLLSFTMMAKDTLREILQSIQGISQYEASQKVFASIFDSQNILKLEVPNLVIHQTLEVFQEINLRNLQLYLQETFNLRETNLILLVDWQKSEELLLEDLSVVIKSIITHFNLTKTTLLIYLDETSEDDAQVMISTVIMNLMMEENIEISDDLQISFVGMLDENEWDALKLQLHAQIVVNQENQMLIPEQLEGIPEYELKQVELI